jgi:hypothetical protein
MPSGIFRARMVQLPSRRGLECWGRVIAWPRCQDLGPSAIVPHLAASVLGGGVGARCQSQGLLLRLPEVVGNKVASYMHSVQALMFRSRADAIFCIYSQSRFRSRSPVTGYFPARRGRDRQMNSANHRIDSVSAETSERQVQPGWGKSRSMVSFPHRSWLSITRKSQY